MRDLLLLLSQYPFREANLESLSKLVGEVKDWQKLVKLINDHGIIALASYNIKKAGLIEKIPADARAILENGYLQNIMRNIWLTQRWKEVNAILNTEGIRHILLKGMALEHTIYGSEGLRQMNDNDIFISPENSLKAWELLKKNGFITEEPKSQLFQNIGAELNMHYPTLYKNGYALEIHDKLLIGSSNLTDPFLDASEISLGDTKALVLSPQLELSYLTKHFESHLAAGDCQVRLYADISLLDKSRVPEIPESFISNPLQSNKLEFRKASYKADLSLLTPKKRILYVLSDIFPSMKWMKKRYSCKGMKVLIYYPLRFGKLSWLL